MSINRKVTFRQVRKNVFLSVFVQILSLCVSFILNLILPKYIDEFNYALWQSFLLYSGYVGLLHFGLLDGIVLRYSQFDYDELDAPKISGQFRLLLYTLTLFCFVGLATTLFITKEEIKWVVLFVAITVITKNLFTYNSYLLQLTNRINIYAKVVLAQRLTFGVFVVLFITLGVQDFRIYCISEIVGDLTGCLVASFYNRKLYFARGERLLTILSEGKRNIIAGINILIANWASIFLLGSARMIIQWNWGLLTFGKVSFAFSMTHLVLSLVTAISVVLFPSLKRIEPERLPFVYNKIRSVTAPFLISLLVLYYPGCWFLNQWLPKYSESLVYLGMTLPIIVYSTEVNLLTNNYLKAYRKENILFRINFISLLVALLGYILITYCFNNIQVLILWAVFIVAARSIVSELFVERMIGLSFKTEHFWEFFMSSFFIILTTLIKADKGWLFYSLLTIVYLVFIHLKRHRASIISA